MLANDPVLSVVSSDKQLISEERLKIIMGIIQQTAVAVENIQLLEARQEEAYISTVLLQRPVVVSSADWGHTRFYCPSYANSGRNRIQRDLHVGC